MLTPILPGFLYDFPDPQDLVRCSFHLPAPHSLLIHHYGQCIDIVWRLAHFPLTLKATSTLGFGVCQPQCLLPSVNYLIEVSSRP